MKKTVLIIFCVLIPLFILLLYLTSFYQYDSSRIVKSKYGIITVFDYYNTSIRAREVGVLVGEFNYNGSILPENYIRITYEGGYLFDFRVTHEHGKFYMYNCTNYDGNISVIGNVNQIELISCEDKCCQNTKNDLIQITQSKMPKLLKLSPNIVVSYNKNKVD